jgi:hypothetical protein
LLLLLQQHWCCWGWHVWQGLQLQQRRLPLLHQHLRWRQLLLLLLLWGMRWRRVVLAVHDQQQELVACNVARDKVLLVAWGDQDGCLEQAGYKLCSRGRHSMRAAGGTGEVAQVRWHR